MMDVELRGRCKELSDAAAAENPDLTVVRGWYDCPIWGRQQHWWCRDLAGGVVDPTAAQFPSGGLGEYVEYAGTYPCESCGEDVHEDDVVTYGHHVYCSGECLCRDIGM